ncbi:hypothetical protein OIU76_023523 [Salix suchowensis]|nr:hypothetical protein OIU76_023523 [Salix suchowensis]
MATVALALPIAVRDVDKGPCSSSPTPTTPSGSGSVADIVTPGFFNGIINQAAASCAGKEFLYKKCISQCCQFLSPVW